MDYIIGQPRPGQPSGNTSRPARSGPDDELIGSAPVPAPGAGTGAGGDA